MYWALFKFALMAAVCVASLRAGAKFAALRAPFGTLLVIGVLCSLIHLIPYVGWILSAYFMLKLLSRLAGAYLWPDAAIATLIAQAPLWLAHFALF